MGWGGSQAAEPTTSFVAVSAGYSHSCGLRVDEKVICWGSNHFGQADVPSGLFTAVSAGGAHSCAVRIDMTLACWGSDSHGSTNALSS
ncbi:hypothetical protein [Candidatus Poriferisodalis sp.]|uniref:hypothetical protein n=1 Tax=Candidatus Poriferisodalis sp. TaxID=3101277 RepID=UPI003AF7FE15